MSTQQENVRRAKIELREAVVKLAKAKDVLKAPELGKMIDRLNELAK